MKWIKNLFRPRPTKTPVKIQVVYYCSVFSGRKYKIQYEVSGVWVDILEWLGDGKYKGDWFNWIEYGGSAREALKKSKRFKCLEDVHDFFKTQNELAEQQYKKWEQQNNANTIS